MTERSGEQPGTPSEKVEPPILFDQYSRYASCAEALRAAMEPGSTVLDVGCGPFRLLGDFLPEGEVSYIDPLLKGDEDGEVIAARLDQLGGESRKWDWVVAVDTLEHIQPHEREQFLRTLVGFARVGAVLCGPYREDDAALDVDKRVNAVYRAKTGTNYSWLDEHIRFGLPSFEATRSFLEVEGFHTGYVGNGHAPWLREFLPVVVTFLDHPEHLSLIQGLSEKFNRELYPFEHLEPVYRRILIATRGSEPRLPLREPVTPQVRKRAAAAWADFQAECVARIARYADLLVTENSMLRELRKKMAETEAALQMADQARLSAERRAAEAVRREAAIAAELDLLYGSRSWKITRPLRASTRGFRFLTQRARLGIGKGVVRAGRFVCDALGLDEEARWSCKRSMVACSRWFPGGTKFLDSYRAELAWRGQSKGNGASSTNAAPLPALPAAVDGLPDVFVWGVIDWYFRFQRPQQLARELARRGHRVFYVSSGILQGSAPDIAVRRVYEDVVLHSVVLVSPHTPTIYAGVPSGAAEEALATSVRRLLTWVRPRSSLTIVNHPGWTRLAGLPPNQRLIYDWMDNHQGFEGTAVELVDAERDLLRRADLTVVTSRWLWNAAKQSTQQLLLLRNACEFEHFHTPPKEVYKNRAGRRIIGYYGAIAEWFDVELVREVAVRFADANVLLIGADSANVGQALRDLPNVEMPGELPYADLSRYLHGMDVCLIPFRINALTVATDPVKVYEYLAAGKPIVSTDLPELREAELDGLVACCEDHEQFVKAVEVALAESVDADVRAQRVARARAESWQERGNQLVGALERLPDPLISIVVVTWNNLDLTRSCVDSLYADLSWPNFELIVVDNDSHDGTSTWLREEAERRTNMRLILNDDNRGFAAANNQGLDIALGEYLVLLNNDTVVTEGWLRQLVAHFRRNPKIGILGPITNSIGNEARIATAYTAIDEMQEEARSFTLARAGLSFEIDVLGFFCVMLPRVVFEEVGPLDEGYGMGFFEDDDYCRRVRETGKRVVCAEDVFVHHELSASFNKIDKKERDELFERSRRYFESKWGEWTPHVYRPQPPSASDSEAFVEDDGPTAILNR